MISVNVCQDSSNQCNSSVIKVKSLTYGQQFM